MSRIRVLPPVKPRPTLVHEDACERCPSTHYPNDPEADAVKEAVSAGLVDKRHYVFPCAWRPDKICKGIADQLNYIGRPLCKNQVLAE